MTTSLDNSLRTTIVTRFGTAAGATHVFGYFEQIMVSCILLNFLPEGTYVAIMNEATGAPPVDGTPFQPNDFVSPFPVNVTDFGNREFFLSSGYIVLSTDNPLDPYPQYHPPPPGLDLGLGCIIYRDLLNPRQS